MFWKCSSLDPEILMQSLRRQGFQWGKFAVICEMGKPHKDDVAAASGGMTPSRSMWRKLDLRWKMVYIVMMMGFISILQLILVENTWWSSRYNPPPHASVDFEETKTTMFQRSSSTSSQHVVLLPNSSRAPPCDTGCSNSNNQHSVQLQVLRDDDMETKPKNKRLLEFSPSDSFLPLKDETQQGLSEEDTNWFMSGLRRNISTSGETFDLPSDDPAGRLLCVRGADQEDGTKNSYGLFRTLPIDALFLTGTTFIADNYWDYHNPWHAMSALANFATWRIENKCAAPERLVLYHMGELRISMGEWITHVLHATFMKPIPLETLTLTLNPSSAVCFERAVMQRRGIGSLDDAHMHGLFDMLRCKARRYCKVPQRQVSQRTIALLLLTRTGPRAFANESGVAAVVRNECEKVPGCSLRVLNAANLTFCEQVATMSRTDVMISVHGAQLTNMVFMDPGSRLMELFPKGWLEFAGIGQYIYKWHAAWTRVIHAGQWRDPLGPDCPFPTSETLPCFFFFKDREVGFNATHLRLWTHSVLVQHGSTPKPSPQTDEALPCACDEIDLGNSYQANVATISKLL